MRRRLVCLGLSGLFVTGCAAPLGYTQLLPAQTSSPALDGGSCRAHGAPTAVILDPVYGSTATAPPPGSPVPTCTAAPTATSLPGPTSTPLPTRVGAHGGRPAVTISSAPQNLTLSPGAERLGRVAVGAAVGAVSWDQSLTLLMVSGAKTVSSRAILGVEAGLGAAVSPRGRIHVLGGRRYTYSDDGGASWAPAAVAPAEGDVHLVVEADGRARAFWSAAGVVRTAKQRLDETWSAQTSLGAAGDFDAVRAGDRVVALTSSPAVVHGFPGGVLSTMGVARRVDLQYRDGELLAGLVRGGDQAVIARSLDGGLRWSECLVQRVEGAVRDVTAIPTEQGPYAVLWVLDDGAFPSIVLSRVHWKRGERCGVWPELGRVDALERAPFIHSPRLFAIGCPQTHFRVASLGGSSLMAFTCLDAGGAPDILVSRMMSSGFFSGPALGGARAGEQGLRDDDPGELSW